ncbi:hypothetical protein [Williamsia herbipolensis]|uniref:hypothetical protein n=1 Tax=Williamsia herbipolensis TaxID=1603258 RepID=UPI0005F7AAED|nr:hypothetical protein [Williamsia herbipolensis]
MSTVDADVLQAQYFMAELEQAAEVLVGQIQSIEQRKSGQREVERRRRELYDVRRQIEALRHRFAKQL